MKLEIKEEIKKPAWFHLEIRNGRLVDIPDKRLVGKYVELGVGSASDRLIIPIRQGRVDLPFDIPFYQEVKKELCSLIQQLYSWFDHEVTIQFTFVDQIYQPAQVFFDHPKPNKTVQSGKLVFHPEAHFGSVAWAQYDEYWVIHEFGWIRVPDHIHWTPDQLEAAFASLALEIK